MEFDESSDEEKETIADKIFVQIEKGNIENVINLLEEYPDYIDAKGRNKWTPVMLAA